MPVADQEHALVSRRISKSFGGVHAVRGVDLAVRQGERRALIGPNGAGKSTLFNLLAGELRSDSGQVLIFGEDVTRQSVQRRARLGLGRTYQISQLFMELTVEQSLFLAGTARSPGVLLSPRGWRSRSVERAWAAEVAGRVGLSDHLFRAVRELSHGLQRQLEVGMALAMRPRLIMLDEPAAGLSPPERLVLAQLLEALPDEITLVLIEHDMDIVLQIARTVTVLHRGQVMAEGSPAEIKANAEVQRVYLGESHA